MGAAEGRECGSWRKVRESGVHRDMREENTSPMPLAGKMRRAEFHDFFLTSKAQGLEFEFPGFG